MLHILHGLLTASGVQVNEESSKCESRDEDEASLWAKCATSDEVRADGCVNEEARGFQAAYVETEDGALEKVPADVETDGQPKLTSAQIAEGEEIARRPVGGTLRCSGASL